MKHSEESDNLKQYIRAQGTVLCIDVGSVALSVVVLDGCKNITHRAYRFHNGDIRRCLARELSRIDGDRPTWIACTASTPRLVAAARRYDNQLATMAAARQRVPRPGAILFVGGEKFGLIRFDAQGRYRGSRSSSSCAAGTGSFLDQQAKRLGLADSAALSATALRADGEAPKIATRCAVFAKTDLIHAQAGGYSLEAICDGLCQGLAINIIDTLAHDEQVPTPLIFAGGVARNQAVARHLGALLKTELRVDEDAHLYGAIGAGLLLLEELERDAHPASIPPVQREPHGLLLEHEEPGQLYYEPLRLELSEYPDFSSERSYAFRPRIMHGAGPVEVDIYAKLEHGTRHAVVLGIDIGSTSTKAVVLDRACEVVAGFYTRTSGQPIRAAQAILEAIDGWCGADGITLEFRAMGTTGSGRKLIGAIFGADLVVDEITAHAEAAKQLHPDVDTIIEIGGQDSKFTSLSEGRVTFCAMNTVCAAGTGSFIEEQAHRLGCPLDQVAERAAGVRAPMTSDRCTVFMERDLNHYLSRGYPAPQLLAAVLHSIRENYLRKVAQEGSLGERICFQGATAKNRSLVAAFEQKLRRPILVSRFCHLTGALGTALILARDLPAKSAFGGLSLCQETIPVRSEVCSLCTNHCKLRIADVRGRTEAYGFLCGRDYGDAAFVSSNRSGFDLLKERKKALAFKPRTRDRSALTVGIPAALYLVEDLGLWRTFFDLLGARVITSEGCRDAVAVGKTIARAEFCAPIAALHGHLNHLARRADLVFLPRYLEARRRDSDAKRKYCYYSQYAVTLAQSCNIVGLREKLVSPLVYQGGSFLPDKERPLKSSMHLIGADRLPVDMLSAHDGMVRFCSKRADSLTLKQRLVEALRPGLGQDLTYRKVSRAYDRALQLDRERKARLARIFTEQRAAGEEISVMLLGRPYTVLSPAMNKGIVDLFASLGVKTFFQDMLPYTREQTRGIAGLLESVHWHYAAKILEVAEVVSNTEGIYPVMITSFKCSPDSFIIEYLRRIFDARRKPYLLLQLDEHDSRVGYETRIEAAVRAFCNHHASQKVDRKTGLRAAHRLPLNPVLVSSHRDRTLLLPNIDSHSCRLVAASLLREGIDARVLEEDELTILKSLRANTGQCIPVSVITQEIVDYIQTHDLDPARTAMWMMDSKVACNFGLFAQYTKSSLEARGGRFAKVEVYHGDLSFMDMSLRAAVNSYFAFMFGGVLRRLGCRVRPYETQPGETDRILARGEAVFLEAFSGRRSKLQAAREVADLFLSVSQRPTKRPKVAIFGDMYVRDNAVMNQQLIHTIEAHGGEVVTTPFSDFIKIVSGAYLRRWRREGQLLDVAASRLTLASLTAWERRYLAQFERVLGPANGAAPRGLTDRVLRHFDVHLLNDGESFDNLLKILHILDLHPDLSLFVQTSPAFCCPSLVTEAMTAQIERVTGVPVVTVTYDGTLSDKNDVVIPYLRYPRQEPS